MAKKRNNSDRNKDPVVLQVNLLGVVVFSFSIVAAAALAAYAIATLSTRPQAVAAHDTAGSPGPAPAQMPPWGELVIRDIRIEPPEEYLGFELHETKQPAWVFGGLSIAEVRELMLSCGFTQQQVERALEHSIASVSPSNTVVHPDGDLIFSLSPETRAKLYHELARSPENQHMQFPFCYSGGSFEKCFAANAVNSTVTAMVKQLLYQRGELECFSDYELVLQQIPDSAEKMRFLRALSGQSAVMARVRIRPETDMDQLLNYWSRPGGVRLKDVRPLLESMRQVSDGTVPLPYLLPQFARQRLYTFPMPSQPGDPTIDCHWSTMNFFNEIPDNRFTDTGYTVKYLEANYYQVAKPTKYGDIVMFLDGDSNHAIHSAVYLADDIVFTKNGNNVAQPWMLMHLKDLVMKYQSDDQGHTRVYRNKTS